MTKEEREESREGGIDEGKEQRKISKWKEEKRNDSRYKEIKKCINEGKEGFQSSDFSLTMLFLFNSQVILPRVNHLKNSSPG